MERNPKKKINGIVNLHDIRFCASLGIDFISMNVTVPKALNISMEILPEIAKWITGSQLLAYVPTHLELLRQFQTTDNIGIETLEANISFLREENLFSNSSPVFVRCLYNDRCLKILKELSKSKNVYIEIIINKEEEIEKIASRFPEYISKIFFNLENLPEFPKTFPYNLSWGAHFVSEGVLDYDALESVLI